MEIMRKSPTVEGNLMLVLVSVGRRCVCVCGYGVAGQDAFVLIARAS